MNVTEFIGIEMQKPFAWGVTDCASTADRWFEHRHGYSAMTSYGRKTVDEETGREWLAEPGGIIRGMREVLSHAGFARVNGAPLPGDVGIIIVGQRACIAVFDVSHWWSRDTDGFITADDSFRYIAWSTR